MNKPLTLEDLILLGIDAVIKKKKKCSYSDLIKELFFRYPGYFSISDYPEWPDTLKLDRPLRSLRSDRLINGSPITFYNLTPLGVERALELKSSENNLIKKAKLTRSPSLTILDELESTQDFKEFISDRPNFNPSDMKIRALMRFTLETPKKTVLNHLRFLKKVSHKKRKQILEDFLTTYINYMEGLN